MADELRDKAAQFIAARGALQSAGALAVVNASPVNRARLDALNKRAVLLQKVIESAGRMVDGARRWFADTFGIKLETSAPVAETAISGTVQAAIAGMNYFIRDVNEELMRINALDVKYRAMTPEQRDSVLSELHAETPAPAAPFPIPGEMKWVLVAVAGAGLFWYLNSESGYGD